MLQSFAPYPLRPPRVLNIRIGVTTVLISFTSSPTLTKCNQLFIHTSDFLLIIIIVTRREELSKDQSWYIDLLYLVLYNRNTFPIIPNSDGVIFTEIINIYNLLCAKKCSETKHEDVTCKQILSN